MHLEWLENIPAVVMMLGIVLSTTIAGGLISWHPGMKSRPLGLPTACSAICHLSQHPADALARSLWESLRVDRDCAG
jgi:hypothetical protein